MKIHHLVVERYFHGIQNNNAALHDAQKVDELVALAKDQGFITYEEINEILPMTFDSAEIIDQVLIFLSGMDIQVLNQSEVERQKEKKKEETKCKNESKKDESKEENKNKCKCREEEKSDKIENSSENSTQ